MVGMSGDARLIAFMAFDSALVPGGVNFGAQQIVVRDTCIGVAAGCVPTTFLLSRRIDNGAPGNDGSDRPALSADGRYGVFRSAAANLLSTGNTGGPHVYRAATSR